MSDCRKDDCRRSRTLAMTAALCFIAASGCTETPGVGVSQSVVPTTETSIRSGAAPSTSPAEGQTFEAASPRAPSTANSVKANATQSLTFDDIKFEMDKKTEFDRSMLTAKIEGYEGAGIRIRGFMLPSYKQDGLTEFVLVRDNQECCFGPGAALYDCIMVRMQPGKATSYSIRPVAVDGKFSIKEWKDYDGVVRAIYHLEGTAVN